MNRRLTAHETSRRVGPVLALLWVGLSSLTFRTVRLGSLTYESPGCLATCRLLIESGISRNRPRAPKDESPRRRLPARAEDLLAE